MVPSYLHSYDLISSQPELRDVPNPSEVRGLLFHDRGIFQHPTNDDNSDKTIPLPKMPWRSLAAAP